MIDDLGSTPSYSQFVNEQIQEALDYKTEEVPILKQIQREITKKKRIDVTEEQRARLSLAFCSHLAGKGAPLKAIQELAGHADIGTTLRYMHIAPSALEEAVSLMNRG